MNGKYFSVRFTQTANNAILRRIEEMASVNAFVSVSVGVFDNSVAQGQTASPVQKARLCEFGAMHAGKALPPRPFLRPTYTERRNAWSKFLRRKLTGTILSDKSAVKDALKQLGEKMVYDVKTKILSSVSPANNPNYFLWKLKHVTGANGYRGTLAKTGELYDSIEYRLYRKRDVRKDK